MRNGKKVVSKWKFEKNWIEKLIKQMHMQFAAVCSMLLFISFLIYFVIFNENALVLGKCYLAYYNKKIINKGR